MQSLGSINDIVLKQYIGNCWIAGICIYDCVEASIKLSNNRSGLESPAKFVDESLLFFCTQAGYIIGYVNKSSVFASRTYD